MCLVPRPGCLVWAGQDLLNQSLQVASSQGLETAWNNPGNVGTNSIWHREKWKGIRGLRPEPWVGPYLESGGTEGHRVAPGA